MNIIHSKMVLILLVTVTFCLQAKVITVPKNERDIQSAIDKADPGDTVYILNGFYRELLTLKDNIFIIGESISGTIIQGNGRDPVIKAADKVLIKKLTIQNGSAGIKCENSACTIEDVLVRDNKGTGIHCLVTLPEIRNCVIFRNSWTGIFCESTRSIKSAIEHNIITDNGYCGIKLAGRSEVLILNNVLLNNKEYGIWSIDESRRSRVVYNNFFNNRLSFNIFTQADRSNLNEDPGYSIDSDGNNFFSEQPQVLLGKGKDGATVGLIAEKDLLVRLTDPDADGITNETDGCPSMAEDLDGFEDEDGCPDFDNDNDGIYDTQDRCPELAEDFDGFKDEDGCDDFDNDNDNIPDNKDVCPKDPETFNKFKEDDGCPDEAPEK